MSERAGAQSAGHAIRQGSNAVCSVRGEKVERACSRLKRGENLRHQYTIHIYVCVVLSPSSERSNNCLTNTQSGWRRAG